MIEQLKLFFLKEDMVDWKKGYNALIVIFKEKRNEWNLINIYEAL